MARTVEDSAAWKVIPLGADSTVVHASPTPDSIFLARPAILALPGGRIVVAFDQDGPGVRKLPGAKGRNHNTHHFLQGRIFVSPDKGVTWSARQAFPFCNPCLFNVGHRIYLLGHKGNVQIMRSDDGGETWSQPSDLTSKDGPGGRYVQGASNVVISNGFLYTTMMQYAGKGSRMSSPGLRAIVAMRAEEGVNVTARSSWTFSPPSKPFCELIPHEELDYFGMPFYEPPANGRSKDLGGGRWAGHPGWGYPQCVKIPDSDHLWHKAQGKEIHILASAELHRSNMAVMMKMTDCEGAMSMGMVAGAGNRKVAFLPLPGGNQKFAVLFDDESKLHWLLSNQITDSMTPPRKLARARRGLPADQCSRLALHFSKNLVDWCFAGFVDAGSDDGAARRTASMAVRGKDLCIVCCAGDEHSKDSHHTNLITFHSVPAFRELVY